MRTADVLSSCASATWAAATPQVSVVVATHDRAHYLPELVRSLEVLEPPLGGLEVVVADDGSVDGTWRELERLVATSTLAVLALRLAASGGPSVPRNTAVTHSRGVSLALTDDDCLPTPGWVRALDAALSDGAAIVQGLTLAVPGGPSGPWDRTIEVRRMSGLYETCNVGLRRELFLGLGGFGELSVLRGAARGFGEDVLLGAAAARAGPAVWSEEAVVHHRWVPGSYRAHLAARRRLVGFPRLVRELPELRANFWHRWFLSRRTATVDLGLLGLGVAVTRRRLSPAFVALPWLAVAVGEARRRPGRSLPRRLTQVLVADALAAASLAEGSARQRTPLL